MVFAFDCRGTLIKRSAVPLDLLVCPELSFHILVLVRINAFIFCLAVLCTSTPWLVLILAKLPSPSSQDVGGVVQ